MFKEGPFFKQENKELVFYVLGPPKTKSYSIHTPTSIVMFPDVPSEEPFSYVARIPVFICALKESLFMFVLRDTFTAKRTKTPDGIVMTELETNCSVGEGFIRVEVSVSLAEKIEILLEIFSWLEAVVATSNDAIVSVSEFCMLREVKVKFCEVFSLEEACVNEVLWPVSDDSNTCGLVVITKNSLERFPLEEGVADTFIDVTAVYFDSNTCGLVVITKNSLERFPLEEGVADTFIDVTAVYFEVCDAAKRVVCVGGTLWKETLSAGVALDCSTELLVVLTGLPSLERLEIVVLEAEDSAVKLVTRKLPNVWTCEDLTDVLTSVNRSVCDVSRLLICVSDLLGSVVTCEGADGNTE